MLYKCLLSLQQHNEHAHQFAPAFVIVSFGPLQVNAQDLEPLTFGSQRHGDCHILMPLYCKPMPLSVCLMCAADLPFVSMTIDNLSAYPALLSLLESKSL